VAAPSCERYEQPMSTPFQSALENSDLAALRACPKAELHIHAVLGGDRAFLRERTGRDIAPFEGVLNSMDQMHAWNAAAIGDIFDGPEARGLAFEATFVRARRDGVTRIELGEDVWGVTLHDGSASAVWEMLTAAHARGAPEIEWIPQIGLSRHCSFRALETWMSPML
jgi:adenosine deaminase